MPNAQNQIRLSSYDGSLLRQTLELPRTDGTVEETPREFYARELHERSRSSRHVRSHGKIARLLSWTLSNTSSQRYKLDATENCSFIDRLAPHNNDEVTHLYHADCQHTSCTTSFQSLTDGPA